MIGGVFGADRFIRRSFLGGQNIELIFEGFFLLNMLKNFTTSYQINIESPKIKNLGDIASNYFQTTFIRDAAPIIPITFIISEFDEVLDLLFLVKLLRILDGLQFLDSGIWIKIFSDNQRARALKRIKYDHEFAEDTEKDNNGFEIRLLLKYCMNTLYLVITIFNITFMIAMFFLKFVHVYDYILITYMDIDQEDNFEKTFFGRFNDHSKARLTIVMTYFSFTSLSTVGFGDLHPRSD